MNKQAYLSQYMKLKSWIAADEDNLQRARASMEGISSPDMQKQQVQVTRRNEAPYVRILEEIDRLNARVNMEKDLLWRLRGEMLPLLGTLPPEKNRLMGARYISGCKWEQIMEDQHLSKSTALRWHRQCLQQLVLPENAVNAKEELEQLNAGQKGTECVVIK